MASALDLHVHTTALSLLCLAAMAAAGLASLATMVYFRGRHFRIIGRLDKLVNRTPHIDQHEKNKIGKRKRGGRLRGWTPSPPPAPLRHGLPSFGPADIYAELSLSEWRSRYGIPQKN